MCLVVTVFRYATCERKSLKMCKIIQFMKAFIFLVTVKHKERKQ